MKMLRAAFVALLFSAAPALAQWQTPTHSVPIGQGIGITGFGSAAPSTAGQPLVSNGASADPSFQVVPNAGLATMPANTTKCNATSGTAVPTDCTAATMRSNIAVPGLTTNNTLSGVNGFTGNTYFSSGKPWIDVRSGANGCAAALGNNSNDDTVAIQCQLTFAGASGSAASVVFVPCGNYKTTALIHIPAGIFLIGQGESCSLINGSAGNFNMIQFDGNYSGMIGMFILSNDTSAATGTLVLIPSTAVGVQIRDSYIWGGINPLQIAGVDCYVQNNFIGAAPASGAVSVYLHAGVCKFIGNKIDPPVGTVATGVLINNISSGGTQVIENIFIGNDISGYTGNSVSLDDSADATARTLKTMLIGNVLGAPVNVSSAKFTTITNGELDGNLTIGGAGGSVAIAGVMGNTVTATGASCAANIGITC